MRRMRHRPDSSPKVTRIMHVVDLPVENPWLNGVAEHYDRSRYHHSVVSVGSRTELHDTLQARRVPAFALSADAKSGYPMAALRLQVLLRREHIDLVQTHSFYPSLIGLIAATLAGTPAKLVTRHHSDFTTIFNRPIHRQVDRLQALWSDRTLAASAAVKRDMIRYEHVPEAKITVARYGYDFGLLRPRLSPAERDRMRDELGGRDRIIVATIARLSLEKGHRYLLEAATRLVRRRPQLLFVLVGTGPLDEELQRVARTSDLDGHVRFMGWRSDAWSIIEASDLVVHPTLHEAFCSVIVEAMALERPLVATDVAAAPEQIDDGQTGILVLGRDPSAIEAAIDRILSDSDAARRMGLEARRRVVERFNFPKMMGIYESIYDDVLLSCRQSA
jgi:glycosyltransferase involved in cell wall biosynthesis